MDKLFLHRAICVRALIAFSLFLARSEFSYAGSGNIGDVGDARLSVFDCQAHGGLYCDKKEHVCKAVGKEGDSPPDPGVTFQFKAARVPANADQAINVRDICAVRMLVVAIRTLIASLISYASPIILKPGLLALATLKMSPRSIWMNRNKSGCWTSIEDGSSRMKNAWLSLLLIGVIACGSFGLSQAQTPADEGPLVPLQKEAGPPPQVRRDLSKIFASAPENPPEALPPSKMHMESHEQLHVIHPGGHGDQDFSAPTPECEQAIYDALNARALVPAPDQQCADMMEKALAVRLQSER